LRGLATVAQSLILYHRRSNHREVGEIGEFAKENHYFFLPNLPVIFIRRE
jgi:hypothetical protein